VQPVSGREGAAAPEIVVLRPRLSERIWGFTELPKFLPQPEPGKPVGEAWLTAAECVAESSGEASGLTLQELTRRWPAQFGAVGDGEFPLLMKWLFPREKLSVQVHPNDEQARAVGEPRGKTECWYVLSAEPGATVAVGFSEKNSREEISREEIARAIADGTLESRLRYIPVKAGDMVYLEAGTIHAMNPGVVVLETQQYSDTTYRLYDYGRPRELHLERGLAVTRPRTASGLVAPVEHDGFVRLVESPYFVVDRFRLAEGSPMSLEMESKMQILVALSEGASLRLRAGVTRELPAGYAVVLPASSAESTLLEGTRVAEVIRVFVP
jgi:mannose-6-phosphate isomerase